MIRYQKWRRKNLIIYRGWSDICRGDFSLSWLSRILTKTGPGNNRPRNTGRGPMQKSPKRSSTKVWSPGQVWSSLVTCHNAPATKLSSEAQGLSVLSPRNNPGRQGPELSSLFHWWVNEGTNWLHILLKVRLFVNEWQSWDLNPESLAPKPIALTTRWHDFSSCSFFDGFHA